MKLFSVALCALLPLWGVVGWNATGRLPQTPKAAPAAASLDAGKGTYSFADTKGSGKTLPVHYFRPEGVSVDTAPILFVMHGTLRNGAEYRDLWIAQATRYKALLVVPEFGKDDFPSGLYNRGNVRGRDDKEPEPESKWTFGILERVFDDVKARTGNKSGGYYLYGHSAGGQFVHRLMLLSEKTRCKRAVAANAGYYTLPTRKNDPPYPFSLAGVPPATEARQKAAFGREMVVLLGEADTDPKDPDLYHSPEADAQGMFRFARGQFFFAYAQKEAARLKTPLRWTLRTVPGVGHSNEEMAPAAADALLGK